LEDHDYPFGWVFREPKPFLLGSLRLDWTGAMGRVGCGTAGNRPTLWQFAKITGRGSAIPFTLSDGTPVPQLIAYLLGVTRIRADERVRADQRVLLEEGLRAFGLSLMADLILGPDDEPICRVSDSLDTIYLLGEMTTSAATITSSELAARLRDVNSPRSE
jgi:hypothetical protein